MPHAVANGSISASWQAPIQRVHDSGSCTTSARRPAPGGVFLGGYPPVGCCRAYDRGPGPAVDLIGLRRLCRVCGGHSWQRSSRRRFLLPGHMIATVSPVEAAGVDSPGVSSGPIRTSDPKARWDGGDAAAGPAGCLPDANRRRVLDVLRWRLRPRLSPRHGEIDSRGIEFADHLVRLGATSSGVQFGRPLDSGHTAVRCHRSKGDFLFWW
jgi:hypothetical protein